MVVLSAFWQRLQAKFWDKIREKIDESYANLEDEFDDLEDGELYIFYVSEYFESSRIVRVGAPNPHQAANVWAEFMANDEGKVHKDLTCHIRDGAGNYIGNGR